MGFFQKIKNAIMGESTKQNEKYVAGLDKSSSSFSSKINELAASYREFDYDYFEELENVLIMSDVGVNMVMKIVDEIKKEVRLQNIQDPKEINEIIIDKMFVIYANDSYMTTKINYAQDGLTVILMVGVNGAGKTTTIGKLASKFKAQGLKVMLAAGDTFRAAAVEQLKTWGDRCDIPVVSQPTGSDSASVIFDALSSAIAHKVDVLICDTAGRLQNKDNLMEELKKITRVMKKHSESVPNEVMLVLDSTTGQNAISQMKIFSQAVNVTGITLTKLDGTAKGGIIFALSDQFKVPVRYIGIGEKVEDLREFDSESFVDALVD